MFVRIWFFLHLCHFSFGFLNALNNRFDVLVSSDAKLQTFSHLLPIPSNRFLCNNSRDISVELVIEAKANRDMISGKLRWDELQKPSRPPKNTYSSVVASSIVVQQPVVDR